MDFGPFRLNGPMDEVDRERLQEGLNWLRRDGSLALSLADGVAEAVAARTRDDSEARMLAIDHADQLAGLLEDMPAGVRELRDLLERLIEEFTLHACPCCGNYTLSDPPPGSDEICPVCWWQDDYVGFHQPEHACGPNRVSLDEGRRQFLTRGYADLRGADHVRDPALTSGRSVSAANSRCHDGCL